MRQNKPIVASGHPLVCEAAISIMAQGGNAFDAAVAGGFVSALAEPGLTSLGGGGFLLSRTREESILFDFFSDTPGKGRATDDLEPHFFTVTIPFGSGGVDQDFNVGRGSVAVPGVLKGLLHVHRRLGRLELKDVLAPAITAARNGVVVRPMQALFFQLLEPILTMPAAGKKLYMPDGKLLGAGDLLINRDYGDFLEQLGGNPEKTFYSGELARRIAQDMEEGQGLLTAEDLASYQVVERNPLKISYRGLSMLTNPPPSFGGSLIAGGLARLERYPLSSFSPGSAEHLTAKATVMQEVEAERLSPAFSRGTTHFSVVDGDGNVASMTTSNGEGSGYMIPGTGIMLNNMMGEDDLHPDGFHSTPPGHRVASMMSPSLILDGDKVVLVIGSGGSKRIRTAITQVLSLVVDFSMPLRDAVNFPRLHWDGDVFQAEPGFEASALDALKKLGPVNIWPELNVYFGGVHSVIPGRSGAGDPRRGGDSRILEL
ncbi:MAG: gamma-glutamyltransferase [Thermodesulfobacteriota bacterium]|nr:gamma-glutamyltransferase [Thermodesulfobacteriota bacterium]